MAEGVEQLKSEHGVYPSLRSIRTPRELSFPGHSFETPPSSNPICLPDLLAPSKGSSSADYTQCL